MALTDTKLRTLKTKDVPFKVADGEGLFLLVQPTGSKLWRLAYRYFGKQQALALGQFPTIPLREACRARDDAKEQLAKGVDPSTARKAERREKRIAAGSTFALVAEEWFENYKARWVKSYASRLRSRLDEDLIPALGRLPHSFLNAP